MENTGTTPTPATPDGGTKPEALTAETLETLLNKRDETLVNQILGKLEHQKSLESMDEDERKAAENEDKIKTLEAENAKYKIEAKKEEFAALSIAEQQQIFSENTSLYEKLI